MSGQAHEEAIVLYNAIWPHLVGRIGVAVDGDPEKIKELQRVSPLNLLGDYGSKNVAEVTDTVVPDAMTIPDSSKRKRNRYPCYTCKKSRQKCIRSSVSESCKRCIQKHLECSQYSIDGDNSEEPHTPHPALELNSKILVDTNATPHLQLFNGVQSTDTRQQEIRSDTLCRGYDLAPSIVTVPGSTNIGHVRPSFYDESGDCTWPYV